MHNETFPFTPHKCTLRSRTIPNSFRLWVCVTSSTAQHLKTGQDRDVFNEQYLTTILNCLCVIHSTKQFICPVKAVPSSPPHLSRGISYSTCRKNGQRCEKTSFDAPFLPMGRMENKERSVLGRLIQLLRCVTT